ncbi:NAD(P)/FAD-dependent oxidoreductase [Phormidesmis sp. 146-33]
MGQKVAIVGSGVVGAAIAYELSKISELTVMVFDQLPAPVEADLIVCPTSTGAALGVLMGAISKKEKGRNLQMRLSSLQAYETLIPELEALTGSVVPYNQQGILMLEFEEDLTRWERLVEIRRSQGLTLEILEVDRLRADFPQLRLDGVKAAIYSPDDRQVNPVALTHALIKAAQQNGATFQFNTKVTGAIDHELHTSHGTIATDWIVISAALGSTPLTATMNQPVDIRPVLGQAIHLRLEKPFQTLEPVITGNDVHLVPLGGGDYWVGATVEFEEDAAPLRPDLAQWEAVINQAIAFCPRLVDAKPIRSWYGLRPRPQGRPAPIVELLPGYNQVLLATGHYRNGVLLAPATAKMVRDAIVKL